MNLEKILSGLQIDESVFKPDEGSMALAETALGYKGKFLEIGTGSGFVSIVLFLNGFEGLACDISQKAVECCRKNFSLFHIDSEPILSNLYERVNGKFDLIIFNPPTNADENESDRKIKNKLKNLLPPGIWKIPSKIYQFGNSKKRRNFIVLFANNSRKFLNEHGTILLNIINIDLKYIQGKLSQANTSIVGDSAYSKILEIKFQ